MANGFEHSRSQNPLFQWRDSQFVAAVHDNSLFVEMIEDISVENRDVLVKFMSYADPTPSLESSGYEEICCVRFGHLLCMIEVPSSKASWRMRKITGHAKFNIKIVQAPEDLETTLCNLYTYHS